MAKEIRFKLLGNFHIFVDGIVCDDKICKTRKGTMLLQFLILQRGKDVPREVLYGVLWPNEESNNPESALKTLISRTRALLAAIHPTFAGCITSSRGGYAFQAVEGCAVDVYEFDALYDALEKAPQTSLTPELRGLYQQLLTVYVGDLLQYSGDGEMWMMSKGVDLHNRYMRAVNRYISLLRDEGDYDEIVSAARVALDVDAFDEQLHVNLMEALVKAGRNNEALLQYKHATHLYYRYMGFQPPQKIQEFYKKIITVGDDLEMNIDLVRRELAESAASAGAFMCEYAVFKDIFSLQMRSMERLGLSIFLVLMKVECFDGKPMEPLRLDDIMRGLGKVLVSNLRKGDTITQFSPSQYALLLPTVNYETGHMVMERIRRAFYREKGNSSLMLSYKMGPIVGGDDTLV